MPKKVKHEESSKLFKFGGGEIKKSNETIIFPCEMAGKKVMMRTEVVDSDIPLLLSKQAMKTAKIKLDLENDKAGIWGKEVDLDNTSSGHYCISLSNSEVPVEECQFTATSIC